MSRSRSPNNNNNNNKSPTRFRSGSSSRGSSHRRSIMTKRNYLDNEGKIESVSSENDDVDRELYDTYNNGRGDNHNDNSSQSSSSCSIATFRSTRSRRNMTHTNTHNLDPTTKEEVRLPFREEEEDGSERVYDTYGRRRSNNNNNNKSFRSSGASRSKSKSRSRSRSRSESRSSTTAECDDDQGRPNKKRPSRFQSEDSDYSSSSNRSNNRSDRKGRSRKQDDEDRSSDASRSSSSIKSCLLTRSRRHSNNNRMKRTTNEFDDEDNDEDDDREEEERSGRSLKSCLSTRSRLLRQSSLRRMSQTRSSSSSDDNNSLPAATINNDADIENQFSNHSFIESIDDDAIHDDIENQLVSIISSSSTSSSSSDSSTHRSSSFRRPRPHSHLSTAAGSVRSLRSKRSRTQSIERQQQHQQGLLRRSLSLRSSLRSVKNSNNNKSTNDIEDIILSSIGKQRGLCRSFSHRSIRRIHSSNSSSSSSSNSSRNSKNNNEDIVSSSLGKLRGLRRSLSHRSIRSIHSSSSSSSSSRKSKNNNNNNNEGIISSSIRQLRGLRRSLSHRSIRSIHSSSSSSSRKSKNNNEDMKGIISSDDDNDEDNDDCVDEHWHDEIISSSAQLLSSTEKGNVPNSVKENNLISSNDEYNCDEYFQDEFSPSADNKDESYRCRKKQKQKQKNNDKKYSNFCSGLHDCPHVHFDDDCCPGFKQIIEIAKEISIEKDCPKFSMKIYNQIRKRLMNTKSKTKKEHKSSNKNEKGKQELLFFQYECNNDERSHTEYINNNSDSSSEANKNKNTDTNNNTHVVYELDTCDLIYDTIRPIYLGERYMTKHAYKHDVYFEYPDHPGTKAFIRAVQQVISVRIRDAVNGTGNDYLKYCDSDDSDHDGADDQDYGRDNNNDNDNDNNNNNDTNTVDTNIVDDIESNNNNNNDNNNNGRNSTIGTYRQIKDKLYDSKFFIGKAPYCIQAKKSIRNIIFKARYESDTAQIRRHIIEQNELDKLKAQQQVDKARPIPGTACKWWFKRMLSRMFAKVCCGSLYTSCSLKMSRCKQRSRYELWLFYNEITLSYYGAPCGGRLKGPMLFLLGCALLVFIFGMTYMIFKFIAIEIFAWLNVSISFAPRIVDFFKDDDDIEI